jgi:1-acyl-sn-glycerol-3-phosphate acyltransferase
MGPQRTFLESLLRTALCLVLLPALIVAGSGLALALALLGTPTRHLNWIYLGCARLCRRVAGTRLEHDVPSGAEPAYVVVPNHESMWDPVCLVEVFRDRTLRFIVKREVMNLPVFGQALRLTGNVSVVRSRTERDVKAIRKRMDRRDRDTSILFFAEGTRSRDGALQPFKMGAFATALAYDLPILPVGIAGTFRIWPKGRLLLRPGLVVVKLGEPIPTAGLGEDDRASLRDRTHAAVVALRTSARARLREIGVEPGGVD